MIYYCPKHKRGLKRIEGYPGALICPIEAKECPDIYSVIGGHLCVLEGKQWRDTKSGEIKEVTNG